jgi:GTP cyclohydrolase I
MKPTKANETVDIEDGDTEVIKEDLEGIFSDMLAAMQIDYKSDHNTEGTPKRLAKMYIDEVFSGRYYPEPPITTFPNVTNLDEVYSVGPIKFRSTCSHHFAPIIGEVWITVKPGKSLIGLSKFTRITRWIMSRPHIQEEAIMMLADYFEKAIEPEGIAITMKASHFCMVWRGVKEDKTTMINTVVRGCFLDNPELKKEHFKHIESQGF